MTISVLINGAFGKMGQEATKAIGSSSLFTLSGTLGRSDNLKVEIQKNQPQVVLDLTAPEAVYENTSTIIEMDAHPVIGTTGLTDEQIQSLTKSCEKKQLGGLIVPNFSVATILMMKCAQLCSQYLPQAEIIEFHHDQKKDAPSGTAVKTADLMADARKNQVTPCDSKEFISGARGAQKNDIPIHSVRLPGLLAHQSVIFGNEGETLTIKQDTLNRSAFMPGILIACEKVVSLKTMLYGLETIL